METLQDVIDAYSRLDDATTTGRRVLAPAMATAMEWMVQIPHGPAREEALDLLVKAAERAVAAAGTRT